MKKIIIAIAIFSSLALHSCSNLDEQPPINDGYKTEFVLPKGEFLNDDDRAYLKALEQEYNENVK